MISRCKKSGNISWLLETWQPCHSSRIVTAAASEGKRITCSNHEVQLWVYGTVRDLTKNCFIIMVLSYLFFSRLDCVLSNRSLGPRSLSRREVKVNKSSFGQHAVMDRLNSQHETKCQLPLPPPLSSDEIQAHKIKKSAE